MMCPTTHSIGPTTHSIGRNLGWCPTGRNLGWCPIGRNLGWCHPTTHSIGRNLGGGSHGEGECHAYEDKVEAVVAQECETGGRD